MFYPAKIIGFNKESLLYHVHFSKWQRKFDEWIPQSHLKLLNSSSSSSSSSSMVKAAAATVAGCRVCKKDDDYTNIVLCDRCNGEYHLYCLQPPLEKLPRCLWFCDECVAQGHGWSDVSKGESVVGRSGGSGGGWWWEWWWVMALMFVCFFFFFFFFVHRLPHRTTRN